MRFDFEGFRRAFAAKGVAAWASYFAEDAEWIEYKPEYPPRAPRVMAGKAAITEYITAIAAEDITLAISDEIVGPTRASFCAWCTSPDGSRIIEHILLHYANGKIIRQVDVEAWD